VHNATTTNPTVVVGESHGSTVSGTFTYTGTLTNTPVNPFSVTIQIGASIFAKDTFFGNFSGTGVSFGTLNYTTGAYSFTLTSNPGTGLAINASYTYNYPWSSDDFSGQAMALVIQGEPTGNQPQGIYLYSQANAGTASSASWPQSINQQFVTSASFGTWTSSPITFSGILAHPVVPGMVQVYDNAVLISTDNFGGSFSGTYLGATLSGSINYTTGAFSFTFTGGSPNGGSITVQYFQALGWSQQTILMDKNGNMFVSGDTLTINNNPVANYQTATLNFNTTGATYGSQQGNIVFDQNGSASITTQLANVGPSWTFDAINAILYVPGDIDVQTYDAGNTINFGAVQAGNINIGSTTSANLNGISILTPGGVGDFISLQSRSINVGTGSVTLDVFLGHGSTGTQNLTQVSGKFAIYGSGSPGGAFYNKLVDLTPYGFQTVGGGGPAAPSLVQVGAQLFVDYAAANGSGYSGAWYTPVSAIDLNTTATSATAVPVQMAATFYNPTGGSINVSFEALWNIGAGVTFTFSVTGLGAGSFSSVQFSNSTVNLSLGTLGGGTIRMINTGTTACDVVTMALSYQAYITT